MTPERARERLQELECTTALPWSEARINDAITAVCAGVAQCHGRGETFDVSGTLDVLDNLSHQQPSMNPTQVVWWVNNQSILYELLGRRPYRFMLKFPLHTISLDRLHAFDVSQARAVVRRRLL